jgi:hypothetical protein
MKVDPVGLYAISQAMTHDALLTVSVSAFE